MKFLNPITFFTLMLPTTVMGAGILLLESLALKVLKLEVNGERIEASITGTFFNMFESKAEYEGKYVGYKDGVLVMTDSNEDVLHFVFNEERDAFDLEYQPGELFEIANNNLIYPLGGYEDGETFRIVYIGE
ncbi:hypothetical protein METBIDRAFT_33187 [Metschnikowia bicuspidata var. bicuspidata NRRL YB-4993]|uniref:Uncharacterized protein n=1 Tax=Metschnikowia bicuspidata var. bicuspidata NRRL YB-4993 TaxID=869754 RepID=A0A1A0H6I0_9ASCO|nr:hypothetical protein METBIDRAFT_33187 [Metschnikowia bicuspidata var. bicuspidata NRRL YB-4993]OBA19518.1 hypothetical protein METBIDRAFT_33187 [Metschnikowia bicuspidata var. bicuspidata NRRL YB-4993]